VKLLVALALWPLLTAEEAQRRAPVIRLHDVLANGGEVARVTDQQLQDLIKLIQLKPDTDPEKPELMFRLAELYRREYDRQERAGDPVKAKPWLLAAVKQSLEIVDEPAKYSSYGRTDEVLFYLAHLLMLAKRDDVARKYFMRLIKDYPFSQYIPTAYAAFGDFFFGIQDLNNALKFYDKALQYPKSPAYTYAKYMSGWVYINQGDLKQALASFIDAAKDNNLQPEVAKDIARTYARLHGANPQKAWPFFQRYGGDNAAAMLDRLAQYYRIDNRPDAAIHVYQQQMMLFPTSEYVCQWQAEIVDATKQMHPGPDAQTVKELQRLAAVHRKLSGQQGCAARTQSALRTTLDAWQATGGPDADRLIPYLEKELATLP
jgi:tetratricopeptide (TPR) repeat protein